MNQETKILATVDGKPWTISESSLRRHLKLNDEELISSLLDTELFENLSLMGYNILPNQTFTFQKANFHISGTTNRVYNFSKMIFDGMVRNINNEPTSLSRDDKKGEAFFTVSSLDAGQDRENIAKTSTMPHESSPRVPSLSADEGTKIKDQDLEISGLKARVKSLEDKERRRAEPTQEDALITRGIINIEEELGAEMSTELGNNDTKEIVNVLSSMEAANILSSRGAAASISPANVLLAVGVPTDSGSFPTVSVIFTTASMVTPYTRRSRGITVGSSQPMILVIGAKDKGKEKMIETKVSNKRKLQEQIDAQVAREMEEEFARENQRLSEQLARDSKMERLHVEEELKIMIEGLNRINEVIAKHLSEYEQAKADLSVGEKIELIRELVKETFNIKQATRDKEKELWVELKRVFEPDFEDQLWTHHQAFMHDPLDWKLFDTCGVHHVSTKDQEIFMLVEKDYSLRKGLATMMINDWIRLFQPMFDEYLNPPNIVVSPVQEAIALRAEVLADSPVSTSID
nr:hypothetical protein [Tanacetum cinerariifolium]